MYEKGLVTKDDLGGVPLAWGESEAYASAVRRIVRRPTDLYRSLGVSSTRPPSTAGESSRLHSMETRLPGYHTGPACPLGFLTGSRHSHLDSAGDRLTPKASGGGVPRTDDETVDVLLAEERWRQALSNLVGGFFSRGLYAPDAVAQALAPSGSR